MPRVTQRAAGLRLEPRSLDTQLESVRPAFVFWRLQVSAGFSDSACFLPLSPIMGAHTVLGEGGGGAEDVIPVGVAWGWNPWKDEPGGGGSICPTTSHPPAAPRAVVYLTRQPFWARGWGALGG